MAAAAGSYVTAYVVLQVGRSLILSPYPSRLECLSTVEHFITLTAISEWVVNSPLDCLVGDAQFLSSELTTDNN